MITKNDKNTTLSSLGILVTDFLDSSPSMTLNRREVTNRSGYIYNGAVHKEKTIQVVGKICVSSEYDFELKKDEINGLISNDEPFYLTKMLPEQGMYSFELPGERTGDLELLSIPHKEYRYRYKVILEDSIGYEFVGRYSEGMLIAFSATFKTAELPYGETIPKNITVTDSIPYEGTAKCNQLEWPWEIKLTASANQTGLIKLMIGERTFTYQANMAINSGDVIRISGVETTVNDINVNDWTNYEHFILEPSSNKTIPVVTNFKGKIQIINKVDLYK